MNQKQAFLDAFLNPGKEAEIYQAVVKEVSGNTCTLALLPNEIEVTGCRLVADSDAKASVRITPEVGSLVVVACIERDLANLAIIQYSEVAAFEAIVGKNKVTLDKQKAELIQGNTFVSLQSERVNIANDSANLKEIFSDLMSLIEGLKVITAQGPSTALTPDTLAALTQLKLKFPKLLL